MNGGTHSPDDYAIGGNAPARVERPHDIAELSSILRAADDAGKAVVLFGGSTQQSSGFAPARYDVAIDVRELAGTIAYESHDLTISVRAGTTLAALDAVLAEHGQFIPLDAPRPGQATVGGTIASGWTGPRRGTYGRARDFIIGSRAVLADGTIARAGGMVVKNVTGYDMSRLYVGSFGGLVALAEINFKTLPLPKARRAATFALPAGSRAAALAAVARCAIVPVAALAIAGFAGEIPGEGGPDGRLFALFEGSRAFAERGIAELESALAAADVAAAAETAHDAAAASALQAIIDAMVAPRGGASMTYRIGDEPAFETTLGSLRAAEANGFACESIADVVNGGGFVRYGAPHAGDLVTLDAALAKMAPQRIIVQSPAGIRERLAMWGDDPASLATLRGLKTRFDPRGTLAPGRGVGRL